MQPFLALITPVQAQPPGSPPGIWGGANQPFPGYGLPGQPPGIWGPTDPRPGWGLPPAGPGQPPGTWGGSGEPFPGYGLPGQPPGIWGPNDPRPGWGLPGQPPGTWGGGNVPMPSPPIYFPPEGNVPPGTWGGSGQPFPQPPIELPPGLPPTIDDKPIDWKVGWTSQTGWIVVGVPQFPHVTPSQAQPSQPTTEPKKK